MVFRCFFFFFLNFSTGWTFFGGFWRLSKISDRNLRPDVFVNHPSLYEKTPGIPPPKPCIQWPSNRGCRVNDRLTSLDWDPTTCKVEKRCEPRIWMNDELVILASIVRIYPKIDIDLYYEYWVVAFLYQVQILSVKFTFGMILDGTEIHWHTSLLNWTQQALYCRWNLF